jgi:hypothetical protein
LRVVVAAATGSLCPRVVLTAVADVVVLVISYRPVIVASGPRKPWRRRADGR